MKLKLNALEEQFKKDKETADQIFEEQRKVNKKFILKNNKNSNIFILPYRIMRLE